MLPTVAGRVFDGPANLVNRTGQAIVFELAICQNRSRNLACLAKVEPLTWLE